MPVKDDTIAVRPIFIHNSELGDVSIKEIHILTATERVRGVVTDGPVTSYHGTHVATLDGRSR